MKQSGQNAIGIKPEKRHMIKISSEVGSSIKTSRVIYDQARVNISTVNLAEVMQDRLISCGVNLVDRSATIGRGLAGARIATIVSGAIQVTSCVHKNRRSRPLSIGHSLE